MQPLFLIPLTAHENDLQMYAYVLDRSRLQKIFDFICHINTKDATYIYIWYI